MRYSLATIPATGKAEIKFLIRDGSLPMGLGDLLVVARGRLAQRLDCLAQQVSLFSFFPIFLGTYLSPTSPGL